MVRLGDQPAQIEAEPHVPEAPAPLSPGARLVEDPGSLLVLHRRPGVPDRELHAARPGDRLDQDPAPPWGVAERGLEQVVQRPPEEDRVDDGRSGRVHLQGQRQALSLSLAGDAPLGRVQRWE